MSNSFRRTAILRKIWIVNLSFTPKDSTDEKLRALRTFSIHLSVRKSRKNYRKSRASLWRNLSTGTSQTFFSIILCFVAFYSLQVIYVLEQLFYGNYSTLDSHTNTVISYTFVYSSRWPRKQGLRAKAFHFCVQSVTEALESLFRCIMQRVYASVTSVQSSRLKLKS